MAHKTQVPLIIVAVTGLTMLVAFYFKVLTNLESMFYSWTVIVAGFAAVLGIGNLTTLHLRNVMRNHDRILSIVLLVVLWGILLYGLVATQNTRLYNDLFALLYNPIGTTVMSLNAFFIASAAYRALRVRKLEGTTMLVCTLLVIIGNAPIGALIWPGFPVLGSWLQNVPGMGASRGIILSGAIGALAMSLRVLLGIERRHFAGGAEE